MSLIFLIFKINSYKKKTIIQFISIYFSLYFIKAFRILFKRQFTQSINSFFSRKYESFMRDYIIEQIKELCYHVNISMTHFFRYSIKKSIMIIIIIKNISKEKIKLFKR